MACANDYGDDKNKNDSLRSYILSQVLVYYSIQKFDEIASKFNS